MNRLVTPVFALLWACSAPATAPAPDPAFDPELGGRLDAAIAVAQVQLGAPGVSVGVEADDGARWYGASGDADPAAGIALLPTDRFRIGSVTKTFTASAVLLLVAEGAIAYDDAVDDWLPGLVPDGDIITVEMLLQHRSGIRSYTDTAYFVGHLTEPVTPTVIVEESVAEGAEFAPGTDWAYSNTNYILLGMITELAAGAPWHEVVRARVWDPLGLEDTWLEGAEPGGPDVRGHLGGIEITDAYDASWGWTSGGTISTTADLMTWLRALLEGEVLGDPELARMTTDSGAGYGMGMHLLDRPEGRYVGHTGSTQGFNADVFLLEETGTIVTSLVNDFTVEGSDVSAAAWAVLNE